MSQVVIEGDTGWYSEDVEYYPLHKREMKNITECIQNYVLNGHTPTKPILFKDDKVITLGSCFARELRYFLNKYGLSSTNFFISSGHNNTFALADYINWCIDGTISDNAYHYDLSSDDTSITNRFSAEERLNNRNIFKTSKAIVMTLGLSEVWEDKETGSVFWQGIPQSIFDENRHIFRLSTVEENQRNLESIINAIKSINPNCNLIFTLSPVPLKGTFRKQSCITADCVSKSILRVAIDSVMSKSYSNVHYYPSFEIVKWLGCHSKTPAYGMEDGSTRHVSRYYVLNILKSFVRNYYDEESQAIFNRGLLEDGVPEDISQPFTYSAGEKLL
jgi:hypothetical protein